MSELNSSLCQLNWLIAKKGIGKDEERKHVQKPLQVAAPVAAQPPSQPEPPKTRKMYSGSDKPPYSYSQLIRLAIEDTVEKKCTLSDIYAYITQNFQFYRENRNSSWKNSIRHNLSLNKQFNRIERTDGDRRGWWVCVEPPEKKPRVLKGSPVRVNPIYEEFYRKSKCEEHFEPLGKPEEVYLEKTNDAYLTDYAEEFGDFTEQEISDINLFESYDLNSSFRDVYNQIFEKAPDQNATQKAAQIDWLKISLEAAGLDYQDESELAEVDTAKLREYVHNGFPAECDSDASTPRTDSSRHSSDSNTPQLPQDDNLSDDEFDWNKLL